MFPRDQPGTYINSAELFGGLLRLELFGTYERGQDHRLDLVFKNVRAFFAKLPVRRRCRARLAPVWRRFTYQCTARMHIFAPALRVQVAMAAHGAPRHGCIAAAHVSVYYPPCLFGIHLHSCICRVVLACLRHTLRQTLALVHFGHHTRCAALCSCRSPKGTFQTTSRPSGA